MLPYTRHLSLRHCFAPDTIFVYTQILAETRPMFLDDAQIALNDINVNCKDAADHYEDAAGMIEQGATSELFHELARARREAAGELEAHIRRLGVLPRDADGDRETVGRLLARLKANLSEDKRVALLTEREHVEGELAAMVDTALQQDLPADTKAYLRDVQEDITRARERLKQAMNNAVT
jgi:uncharacterized protein (TIGR02284 family)